MEPTMSRRLLNLSNTIRLAIALSLLALGVAPAAAQKPADGGTPAELVATYNTLADGLLALKRTEENLVKTILATSRAHGEVQLMHAKTAITAVRKRLIEAGQHHNAAGEAQGIFDEGYVIVTKAAKQKFLESSRKIAAM